jgi:hypothetical protein
MRMSCEEQFDVEEILRKRIESQERKREIIRTKEKGSCGTMTAHEILRA